MTVRYITQLGVWELLAHPGTEVKSLVTFSLPKSSRASQHSVVERWASCGHLNFGRLSRSNLIPSSAASISRGQIRMRPVLKRQEPLF